MESSFSKRLRDERERAGLSQTKLARMCGLSGTTISCIECGKNFFSERVLVSVSHALGVRPEWLRSGSGKREGEWSNGLVATPKPQSFPERIKQLRKEAGLTQRQLAKLIGVSAAAVSSWETGIRDIPAGNNLVKLAEVLGLDPAEVVKVGGVGVVRNEIQLLAAFRMLPEDKKLEAINLLAALHGAA